MVMMRDFSNSFNSLFIVIKIILHQQCHCQCNVRQNLNIFFHLEAQVVPADPFFARIPWKYFKTFKLTKFWKYFMKKTSLLFWFNQLNVSLVLIHTEVVLKKSQTCFQTSSFEYESFLRKIFKIVESRKRRLFNNLHLQLTLNHNMYIVHTWFANNEEKSTYHHRAQQLSSWTHCDFYQYLLSCATPGCIWWGRKS